jgi:hypothetical protein
MKSPDSFWKSEILRYVTMAISVFSEYLVSQTDRVQRAAASAIRIIIQNGISHELFEKSKKKEDDIAAILSLDALTISEEVENMRNDRRSKNRQYSPQDKLLINVCYLLSTRYAEQYDHVLKLISVFVKKIGVALTEK